MIRQETRPLVHVLALSLIAVAGCVGPPGRLGPDETVEAPTPAATARLTEPRPSATSPTRARTPIPATTAAPTGHSPSPPGEIPTEPADEPAPPVALLTLSDGTSHAGTPGSWCYISACLDAPWLSTRSLPRIRAARAGQPMTVAISEAHGFVSWNARYTPADDRSGENARTLDSGGHGTTPVASARFEGPPRGSWVVAVQLNFGEELGDATYYWHIVVR